MPLRKIVLENYRCFRDRQEIELAPVTVVLGKNNSGKSVLTRAPLVIATGFGTSSTAPLELDRLHPLPVDGFPDLIFEQSTHGRFTLGVEVDGRDAFAMEAGIRYVDEDRAAYVSHLRLASEGESVEYRLQPTIEVTEAGPIYDIRRGAEQSTEPVVFRGLLPAFFDARRATPGRYLWRPSLGPIRFLSAYRDRPERQHRLPFGTPREVGEQGQGVYGILADDEARRSGELIQRVNELLSGIVPDWRIEEIQAGPLWSTVLTRRGSSVRVNLADAGTGLAQVLPILVQCVLDELRGDDLKPLQIIEEPEMHLHPAAHAALADLYLDTVRATGTHFLIESHSETLLLRLRRRIAEGTCEPGAVAVYVVDQQDGVSTAQRVAIDELGNLGAGWPDGYFSQDYQEARALATAQLSRSGYAS
ncbi:AAA family ATPase [Micromonospora mirobrigensis]|uniref:Predicted ATPase n=1 Tax=Micromonospora mirobrigensis TaxID=262898 RepID=A0A1C5AH20_9ACTN|nr:AAA family ATPase [Micromonospora mirobrigensis]SCF44517.1 Predicted ATPase [Micromonospora mirobrigensis]